MEFEIFYILDVQFITHAFSNLERPHNLGILAGSWGCQIWHYASETKVQKFYPSIKLSMRPYFLSDAAALTCTGYF